MASFEVVSFEIVLNNAERSYGTIKNCTKGNEKDFQFAKVNTNFYISQLTENYNQTEPQILQTQKHRYKKIIKKYTNLQNQINELEYCVER